MNNLMLDNNETKLNSRSQIEMVNENELYNNQKNFLESDFVKVINTALDIGLKAILPNLIENDVIDIKNIILEQGFFNGIKEILNSGLDLGKSLSGIVTGNFENISQVQMAIKKGGVLDKISSLLDFSINMANRKNLIDSKIASLIKDGKNTVINSISDKIEENLTTQLKSIEKLENYCSKWESSFNNKDINGMTKAYKSIENYIQKTLPIERIIKQARKIESLHNIIINNGNNFDITKEQEILAEKLA